MFESFAGAGTDNAPLIELLRLRLPSVVSDPLIDLYLVLRAIAAAFMSGIAAMAWPAATLVTGLAIHWGVRILRRR